MLVSAHISRNCKSESSVVFLDWGRTFYRRYSSDRICNSNCVSSSEKVTVAFSLYIRCRLSTGSLLLNTFELPPTTGTHLNLYIFLILKHFLIAVANWETKEIFSAAVVHSSRKDPAKSI